ncbi:MAG: MBL fold metallo-hydrolase [Pseudomonadota bacterium]
MDCSLTVAFTPIDVETVDHTVFGEAVERGKGMKGRRLGDITIDRILEMEAPYQPLSAFFAQATPEAIAPHRHWLEPRALDPATGKIILPVQSYLVRTGHHTILIDTCVGCHKNDTGEPDWTGRRDESWLDRLAAAGVGLEQVDFVFCTHLHADHCGWNTRLVDGRWVPTFPKAKYILAKAEVAAKEAAGGAVYRESVLPILEAGQALLVDQGYALDDQVCLTPLPGHTAGHVGVGLASRGQQAVMIGDIMHSPIQLAHPDWSPVFDFDVALSTQTRQAFLDSHCETDTLVLTAHFPSPSIGHVVAHAKRAFDFRYLGAEME